MNPAQALADLAEISTQLEAAVLATPDGSPVASTLADDGRAKAIAEGAIGLLEGAQSAVHGPRELTQVQAATREGCVFVARDERHVIAGVTGPDPTVGLVFYDLKTTLRAAGEGAAAEKPKQRRPAKKKAAEESGGDGA